MVRAVPRKYNFLQKEEAEDGKPSLSPCKQPQGSSPVPSPGTHAIHHHLAKLPGPKDSLRQLPRVGGAENIHRAHRDLWRLPCPQRDHQPQFSYFLLLTLWTNRRFVCKDQQLRWSMPITAALGKL